MRIDRYFLDFEFHERGDILWPISTGLVDSRGRELYIEFLFDEDEVRRTNPWVAQNVLTQLSWEVYDRMTRHEAAERILDFVGAPAQPAESQRRIEFWGHFPSTDWVLFYRLFGRMIDLPSHFPHMPMCLRQYHVHLGSPPQLKLPKPATGEHNALVDALWNRDQFQLLNDHAPVYQLGPGQWPPA